MWSVHDSIELEKRGIPTATVCSSEFVSLGKATAQTIGMPHIAIVSVSHPVGGVSREEVLKKADDSFEDIMKSLYLKPR
ncbi:hypothetical protein ACFLT4_05550 [Chloroflexota bacterium]